MGESAVVEACWIGLETGDVEAARSFYSDVFEWRPGAPNEEFGGYFMFFAGERPVAGGMANLSQGQSPDQWVVYLRVDDVADTLERAASLGATVVAPAMAVGDMGTMGVMVDPTGAVIGVWAPDTFAGFGPGGGAGVPVWFELHTGDYEGVRDFYAALFGWSWEPMEDSPTMRYSVVREGERPLLGLFDDTAGLGGSAPYWLTYVEVPDADAAVPRAAERGGSALGPARDSPYGRMAVLVDPTGARVAVMQP
jgi:predicted enzyme related to lactoylglutathione lyase